MTDRTVPLWKNNRIDQEYQAQLSELAERFEASEWGQQAWPLGRSLGVFLGHTEQATMDVADQNALLDYIVQTREAARQARPPTPIDVGCSNCQSPAGHPCSQPTDNGRRDVTWFHSAREARAEREAKR